MKPLGLRISDAQRAVRRAVLARDIHAGECLEWDYETECAECTDTCAALSRARDTLRSLEVK